MKSSPLWIVKEVWCQVYLPPGYTSVILADILQFSDLDLKDYFLYKERKEEIRHDGIDDIRFDKKEEENDAVCQEHLEEHIPREENYDKLQPISAQ